MGDSTSSSGGDGCGCGCDCFVYFIVGVLLLTALICGLPVGEHKWNIDLFPPRIWDENAKEAPQ